jgi:hypothetical protein
MVNHVWRTKERGLLSSCEYMSVGGGEAPTDPSLCHCGNSNSTGPKLGERCFCMCNTGEKRRQHGTAPVGIPPMYGRHPIRWAGDDIIAIAQRKERPAVPASRVRLTCRSVSPSKLRPQIDAPSI